MNLLKTQCREAGLRTLISYSRIPIGPEARYPQGWVALSGSYKKFWDGNS